MGSGILIRADASIAIGTGHAMRCLALAQAWQDAGGCVTFAMAETTTAMKDRLLAEGCEVIAIQCEPGSDEDSQQTSKLARERRAQWIVVDGYRFSGRYQDVLRADGYRILFLDDYGHAETYPSDFVLNQNVGADPSLYERRGADTRLLLGARYALLRREFSVWRTWRRDTAEKGRRVLVMMGGSDPENLTARVMAAANHAQVEDLTLTVVLGGSNPHGEKLERIAAESGAKVELLRDPANLAELMAGADMAISAAGSTCWELCLMGVPALLIDVADNQKALAEELQRRECAIHLGDRTVPEKRITEALGSLADSQRLRKSLAARARELVDGHGARRVVATVRQRRCVWLRLASVEDRRLLWEWANDPEVRAASFTSDVIPWETHAAWFDNKIAEMELGGSRQSQIWIGEDEEEAPAGQIRFDRRSDGGWDVGVSVARAMRGRGLAAEMIAQGVRKLRLEHPGAVVHAFIRVSNPASQKAFERAGFRNAGRTMTGGHEATHFVFEER